MVYYDRVISGNLKYGSITSLKGVQVQKFLLWLNVDEIRVDLPPSDYIYFHVGMINKKLDVKQFKKARSCRKPASFQEIWSIMFCLAAEKIKAKKRNVDFVFSFLVGSRMGIGCAATCLGMGLLRISTFRMWDSAEKDLKWYLDMT
ncbi:hypothetical protein CK203_012194 [Vitis vinifera]|uniref:Uncharacterized protein n=1 Tax=Vitis vinifera TaxID=29760 RepID=A0A438JL23_VITVI|nr:hypothetical protein CK203_012194 [Vitis vinifera]